MNTERTLQARILLARATIAVVIALISGVSTIAAQDDDLVVVATELDGDVEIELPESDDWESLDEGDVVPLESRISTGFESEAQLAVGESSTVTAQPLTRVEIEELVQEEGVERSSLDLEVGRIDGEVESLEDAPAEFEVNSEIATASVRGTSFSFDGQSVSVTEGTVAIGNSYGREHSVSPGEESAVTGGTGRPSSPRETRSSRSRVSPYTESSSDSTGGSGAAGRERTSDSGTLTVEFDLSSDDER